jgi:hypothetical protein
VRWSSGLLARRGYSSCARATSWRSAARRAASAAGVVFVPCRIEALTRLAFGGRAFPRSQRSKRVVALGLFGRPHLLIAQRLDVIGGVAPMALPLRPVRQGPYGAEPCRRSRLATPQVVLFLGQHMPAEHDQLARERDGGDLMSTAVGDANEEGMQRSRRLGDGSSRFDGHRARMAAVRLTSAV